jgi:hypothetical protein
VVFVCVCVRARAIYSFLSGELSSGATTVLYLFLTQDVIINT